MSSTPSRPTIAMAETSTGALHILIYTLPLMFAAMLLTFAMPFTGVVTSLLLFACVFILPFKARRGFCPSCGHAKLFPFSGFGNGCKGCGADLVLRGETLHWLEDKPRSKAPPVVKKRPR
ncbi:MAG: hypothetical protein HQM07_07985 [Zetaproteobacteria bacterium]|nr:hypothetical protein [Zetaproteobacteria bacterium]